MAKCHLQQTKQPHSPDKEEEQSGHKERTILITLKGNKYRLQPVGRTIPRALYLFKVILYTLGKPSKNLVAFI